MRKLMLLKLEEDSYYPVTPKPFFNDYISSTIIICTLVSAFIPLSPQLWNYDGQCMRTLAGHQDAVTCLQFDSTRIVSGSLDCNLKFWDIITGDCINTIDWKAAEGHTGVVRYAVALVLTLNEDTERFY